MTVLPDFRYCRPSTSAEAARLHAELDGSRILAGGTDLTVNLRRGLGTPAALIDVSAIPDMTAIDGDGEGLRIGAAVTLAALAEHPVVLARFPALAEAALAVAGPTHRAAATLGGNLCQDTRCVFYNQSEWWRSANGFCLKLNGERCHVVPKNDRCYATYHGDVAPVLLALDAHAEVEGPAGRRSLPLAELFRESGADHLAIGRDELLAAVVIPPPGDWVAGYAKVRVRDAVDFPLAGVAVALCRDGGRIAGLRVAITGTNSAPLTVPVAGVVGAAWDDAAAEAVTAAIRKTANVLRTTVVGPKYRRRVLLAVARRLIDTLWQQAAPSP